MTAALVRGNPLLAIPPVALTMVASLMIYFRLLGRLAWCCLRGDRAALGAEISGEVCGCGGLQRGMAPR